jgi:hypothetical protein
MMALTPDGATKFARTRLEGPSTYPRHVGCRENKARRQLREAYREEAHNKTFLESRGPQTQ